MERFLEEVHKFKLWAEIAGQSYGEWETEYLHWDKIYQAAGELKINIPVGMWSEELINDFLYILARDNLIDALVKRSEEMLSLAKHAVSFQDNHTRWQIA